MGNVKSSKDSEHLQWIHDRIVNVYNESENVDFLHRLRDIIKEVKDTEDGLEAYLKYRENKRKNT